MSDPLKELSDQFPPGCTFHFFDGSVGDTLQMIAHMRQAMQLDVPEEQKCPGCGIIPGTGQRVCELHKSKGQSQQTQKPEETVKDQKPEETEEAQKPEQPKSEKRGLDEKQQGEADKAKDE